MGTTSIGGTLKVEGPASCYAYLNGLTPTAWTSTYISPGGTLYVENNISFGTQPATLMTTNVLLDGGTINSGGTYTMYANDGITVTTNGGTLTCASGTWTTCNIYSSNTAVTIGGAGSVRPGGAAGTTLGTINLGTGTFIKSGGGDCNMGYANPSLEIYSNLVLNGGSLSFNYDATGGTTSLGAVPSTLNPSNIYFNGGSMHVGHSTTIGATRGIYVASGGGTIEDVVSSGGTVTINSPISGPGNMSFPNGHSGTTSAIILAANNTYTGTTTIGASCNVTVGAGGTTGTLGTGNTASSSALTFNRTGSYSYGGVISGSGWVIKTASGTVTLTGANTYSGNTTNSGGTLLINNTSGSGTGTGSVYVNSGTLGGSGTISGAVTINTGATLAPGPTAASVGTLTINNNLSFAGTGGVAVAINKSLSPSNGTVVVTGTLANSGTGTLKVSNLGPALAVGDRFQVFSKPLTGNAMAVSGGGVIWSNNLAVDGSISVASVPIPVITSVSFSGSNLVLAGTNGLPSDGFSVLTSTNVATPLTNWTVFLTNSYDASGNFAVTNTITNTAPAQFFVIESH
jgi:fibronectin-binding autotransporter adhesin